MIKVKLSNGKTISVVKPKNLTLSELCEMIKKDIGCEVVKII